MSVASKTKTKMYTTVFLAFVAVLSVLPTWANTTPGMSSLVAVEQDVVSTQWTQDLSVLRSTLKERFSWVVQEVTSLVHWDTSVTESFHGSAVPRVIDVSQGISIKPANLSQDFFVDVENDPYRSYINRLAAYGVLSSSQKFYPQNYFRLDDFKSLLQKLYIKKTGQSLVSQEILNMTADTSIMTKRHLQQIISLLPDVTSVDIDGNPYDKLIRSEWAYYLVRIFDLPTLDREETSSVVLKDVFVDIVWHPFAPAINTLASLDILSSTTARFYPDNYLRHYDFVIIFVNALLSAKANTLSDVTVSSFADVESAASYLPQLTYAADRGFIDYIITSKRGQLYFEPNVFITKHEVYQILEKALDIQFAYDRQQADTEKMTRAELAQLLVQSFWFEPKISESDTTEIDDITLINKLKVLLSMI